MICDIYPIEVCCPLCHEVVILIERQIPGDELLRNTMEYCDTPIKGSDRVEICPACHGDVGTSIGRMGFVSMVYAAQEES